MAVGLTYDLEIDRPRPAATAFQVRLDDDWLARWTDLKAPHVTAQDVMAMVQFRRIADSALTTVEAEKDEKEDPQSYVSDWTKPEWVIFNADARYWRIQNAGRDYDFIHVQDLRMKPDGSIVQQGPHGEVRPALLWANDLGEASAMMRLLFAVVTEDIVAADGGRSEAFLAVGEIKPGANTPNYAGYTPMPVETAKPVTASGGATAPPPRRGRKLRRSSRNAPGIRRSLPGRRFPARMGQTEADRRVLRRQERQLLRGRHFPALLAGRYSRASVCC